MPPKAAIVRRTISSGSPPRVTTMSGITTGVEVGSGVGLDSTTVVSVGEPVEVEGSVASIGEGTAVAGLTGGGFSGNTCPHASKRASRLRRPAPVRVARRKSRRDNLPADMLFLLPSSSGFLRRLYPLSGFLF